MLLAIDSGNTNIVFAVFDGDALRASWRSSHDIHRTADEYAVWLTQLMSLDSLTLKDITSVVIANVVPSTHHCLDTLCRRYFDVSPLLVSDPKTVLGIKVLIDRPDEVGADRLVNAVAVHDRYKGPIIAMDFGTATTLDVIDGEGNYCGGVIAPGLDLSLEALYMAAAKLPRIAVDRPKRVIGTSTVTAMQSGVFWGYVSLIEGLVTRIGEEFGAEMTVVATGGLSGLFSKASDCIDHHDPELTLRGLYIINQLNASK
ncbi:MAG: type III pantothenate kinase [Rhodospirillaceae bacterium]|jgi:type III pantothenate kinase|nr:type III pantothenate kinase [Rhodospirillaceae bacterium]MBT5373541.1 type III pantothenate kinase [Rhodospirillaceae bacterium]MBT5659580.1 type III pantothenate kinase [Rhodospirillaceae bacterium]MBT5751688.1 type III pantothenate kinase [Rhodospirillaceae bacterium]